MTDDFKEKAEKILADVMPTSAGQGFVAINEMFISLQTSGFTHFEALWLIGYLISNGSDRPIDDE